jgi:O-antigen/teichoic acid export membrane protein
MGISLVSTRLILNALGSTDFGIFSLIGGVIAMLTFLNNAMTQATQRFLNYNLGAGDVEKLKQIFNASVLLHLIIGILVVALIEIAGLWAFDYFLNIPIERLSASKIVFHFIVISTFFTIISVPYDGIINAHEHMLFDSILGIVQSLGILAIALSITILNTDKLEWYGAFMAGLTILLLVIRRIYCRIQYPESKINFNKYLNKHTLIEMINYSKFTLMGATSSMFGAFGVPVILNSFFGTKINAAHGVAIQLNGQISVFSNAMMRALNPQITKSEGSGNRTRMFDLAILGSKYGYLLLAFFAIPFILEADFILKLWLKNPPEYAILFCQFAIVVSMLNQLSIPISNMINAQGNIGRLNVFSSIIFISILPIIYFLFKLQFPPFWFYIVQILLELVLLNLRLYQAKHKLNFPIKLFMTKVLKPVFIITLSMSVIGLSIKYFCEESYFRLIVNFTLVFITSLIITYLFALSVREKFELKKYFLKYH